MGPVTTDEHRWNGPRHAPNVEEVRARAYEIYLARGGSGGSEMEDWLQAERELRATTIPTGT